MFVFRREDLPPDPVFPADLEKLGYFINENDQIKKISDPEQDFQFKVNKNPRWNEMQREAMNECIRNIVSARLRNLGLALLQLPLHSQPKTPRVPILVSKNLSTASRIILVFGEPVQDLGIWAYRVVGTEGINAGSAVSLAEAIFKPNPGGDATKAHNYSKTALVLANTGQLVWHCASGRAVTLPSWSSLARDSAVDPPPVMTWRNEIPHNRNWQEHVGCVFNEVLAARGKFVRKDIKIDVIGLAEGGLGAIRYLANNWNSWSPYISAICLSNPLHTSERDLMGHDTELSQSSFAAFLASRCRAYLLSPHPLGFPLSDTQKHGCNCYSSGEELYEECIMPKAWKHMIGWLNWTYEDPDRCEEQLEVREVDPKISEVE